MTQSEAFTAASKMSEDSVVVKYIDKAGNTCYYPAQDYREAENILIMEGAYSAGSGSTL